MECPLSFPEATLDPEAQKLCKISSRRFYLQLGVLCASVAGLIILLKSKNQKCYNEILGSEWAGGIMVVVIKKGFFLPTTIRIYANEST